MLAKVAPKGALEVHWLKDIERTQIAWLWKPFIQRGAINILTGDPGVGKSTIVCALAADLSRGRRLPLDDEERSPVRTWIMNAEDDKNDTIAWRLDNHAADPRMVMITDRKRTIDALRAKEVTKIAKAEGIGFIVIDPMQSWMGSEINMHQANETRAWGDILREIAIECNLAILVCRHRRKGGPGDNKIMGGLGSVDITGYARSEIAALNPKQGPKFLERIKGNVGKTNQKLGFSIEDHEDPLNQHGVLRWLGEVTAPAGTNTVPKKLKECVEWLHSFLRDGPPNGRPAKEVFKAGIEAKFSESTLKRARKEIAISEGNEKNGYTWRLNADAPFFTTVCHERTDT